MRRTSPTLVDTTRLFDSLFWRALVSQRKALGALADRQLAVAKAYLAQLPLRGLRGVHGGRRRPRGGALLQLPPKKARGESTDQLMSALARMVVDRHAMVSVPGVDCRRAQRKARRGPQGDPVVVASSKCRERLLHCGDDVNDVATVLGRQAAQRQPKGLLAELPAVRERDRHKRNSGSWHRQAERSQQGMYSVKWRS